MSFGVLMQQILVILLEVGLGAVGVLCGKLSDKNCKFLSDFAMSILMPCTILSCLSSAEGKQTVGLLFRLGGIMFCFFVAATMICQLIGRAMGYPSGKRAVLVGAAAMPNCGFVGMPLACGILGQQTGMLFATAAITSYNLWFFTYVASLYRTGEKRDSRSLITPCNVATLAVVLMMVLGLRFPAPVERMVNAVGGCATPIALMIVGAMLARSNLKAMVVKPYLYLVTVLRGIVFPLAFMLVLRLTRLDPVTCMGLSIMACCPSGSMAAVLAKQTGIEEELSSQTVAHSTFFMMVTIPLILALATKWFPI